MFIPLRTDSPLRSTPYLNYALIVLNVCAFVAQRIVQAPEGTLPWYRTYVLSSSHPELFQFVTYGFLHEGWMHLLGNMLFLHVFGNNCNDKMGHVGYAAFYLASVVFSGIAYVTFARQAPVLGASGGVSAVVGAYLILFPRSHVTVLFLFILIGTVEVASFWFVLAFFLKDLVGLSGQSNVAHTAHLGGTLFGIVVSLALLYLHLLPRDQFDVIAMAKQWNRRRAYRAAVSGGWNPYAGGGGNSGGPYRPPAAKPTSWVEEPARPADVYEPTDPRTQQVLELRAEIAEAVAHHKLPEAAKLYLRLKALDPTQVLSRQSQLDVANQLAAEQRYAEAAEAYETFIRQYPKYEQMEQVELMLGLVLNRFLNRPAQAREYLLRASAKLMDEGSRAMAKAELEKVDEALGAGKTGGA